MCSDKASGFHYGVHACEGCKVSPPKGGRGLKCAWRVFLFFSDAEPSGKLFKHAGGSCVGKVGVAPADFSPLTYLAQRLVERPYSTHAVLTQSSLQRGDKTVYFGVPLLQRSVPPACSCRRLRFRSSFRENPIAKPANGERSAEVSDRFCIRLLETLKFKGCWSYQVM